MPERKKKEDKRMKVSGTIPKDQYDWVDKKIKEKDFYNMSHLIQVAIKKLQEEDRE